MDFQSLLFEVSINCKIPLSLMETDSNNKKNYEQSCKLDHFLKLLIDIINFTSPLMDDAGSVYF